MTDFTAFEVKRSGTWTQKVEECILSYDERFLRRKVLKTRTGKKVLVDSLCAKLILLNLGQLFPIKVLLLK